MRKAISCLILAMICAPTTLTQPRQKTDAKKIWSGEGLDFWTGDISSDGRYVSDINWDTGDFQLLNLKTGEMRVFKGVGYDSGGYAWSSAFSYDSRRVALSRYVNQANSHELRVRDVDGGEWQLLVPASEKH